MLRKNSLFLDKTCRKTRAEATNFESPILSKNRLEQIICFQGFTSRYKFFILPISLPVFKFFCDDNTQLAFKSFFKILALETNYFIRNLFSFHALYYARNIVKINILCELTLKLYRHKPIRRSQIAWFIWSFMNLFLNFIDQSVIKHYYYDYGW